MSKEKLVSVILCFFNEEKYLAEAIDSVLAQTYKNFELILVSDGSTDRSCEIADSYDDPRIKRVYLEKNGGLSNARNAGYEAAEGDYIANFDGDDLLMPNKLAVQVRYLNEHPDTIVVSGGYYPIDGDGNISGKPVIPKYLKDIDIRSAELFTPVIANAGASLFRRSLISEHGLKNDPTIHWIEDFHFWHQCFPYGKIENLSEPFFYYRLAYGSKTRQRIAENREKFEDSVFRAFKFGWERRGFDLTDDDIRLITDHLYKTNKSMDHDARNRSRMIYEKIRAQLESLDLPEGERILEIYKERERSCRPDVWVTRRTRKVLKKLIHR